MLTDIVVHLGNAESRIAFLETLSAPESRRLGEQKLLHELRIHTVFPDVSSCAHLEDDGWLA